jgi:hypothetical protein
MSLIKKGKTLINIFWPLYNKMDDSLHMYNYV